jgi:hypothetical protein
LPAPPPWQPDVAHESSPVKRWSSSDASVALTKPQKIESSGRQTERVMGVESRALISARAFLGSKKWEYAQRNSVVPWGHFGSKAGRCTGSPGGVVCGSCT